MSNKGRSFTVVGAGIAGLASATALARQGAQVLVLERAPKITEVGAGLQISPNGMAVLSALGVDCSAAHPVGAVRLRDGLSGASVLRLDIAGAGFAHPYLAWHRADLIDALHRAATAAGVRIRLNADVTGAQVDADGALVRLSSGEEIASLGLIGADGVRSALKDDLLPGPAPHFTGNVAWRATVPAGAMPNEAQVWMMPGRHIVTYPLEHRSLANIVAIQERKAWAAEGWHHPDDPQNLRAVFADAAPPVHKLLENVASCNLWGLFRHPVPEHWQKGTAVLLGDAVHPTLPFMAQGACMALEDAWLMAKHTNADPSLERALNSFVAARLPRTRRIVAAANTNARAYHLSAPLRPAAHLALKLGGALAPRAGLRRFDWLYRFDPTA